MMVQNEAEEYAMTERIFHDTKTNKENTKVKMKESAHTMEESNNKQKKGHAN
jgi:hypothetical protein